ncbi:Protein of unknown function DUF604 [Dillenia turbinata]|uniref:Uncharacterized protein n=1 Tax=Dillenia turbinata TaxID=194707 RepID=A0AAN8YZJ0_9MAGN
MKYPHSLNKTLISSKFLRFFLISSLVFIIYLLFSLYMVGPSKVINVSPSLLYLSEPTSIEHVVFGIASNKDSWPKRKDYVKLWWKPHRMRGCVFLDSMPQNSDATMNDTESSLPPTCISGDTSRFRYTWRGGLRSAIRVARVVSETVALNHSDVRWFVFGDDDTVFFPDNLVKTLSKYDHRLWHYIGTNSEIYKQNRLFSFEMGFGGAGFAISYPLAKVLSKVFDSCLERYPHLYGSDGRIYACLAELGISLTHEPGFHQLDLRGDIFGLLASHPLRPLVSLHHVDHADPIFPNMTAYKAYEHLFKAVNFDSNRLLQQTVCYDRWFMWTISVSWGYAVQIYGYHMYLPDALPVQLTFRQWDKNRENPLASVYTFNIREVHVNKCRRPTIFLMDSVSSSGDQIKSIYKRNLSEDCVPHRDSPWRLEEIRVFSKKLDLDIPQAPRRHCCDVLNSSAGAVMEITLRECAEDELIYMH